MHDLPTAYPFIVRDDGRYFQLVDERTQTVVRISPRSEELELEACARNQVFVAEQQAANRKEIADIIEWIGKAELRMRDIETKLKQCT